MHHGTYLKLLQLSFLIEYHAMTMYTNKCKNWTKLYSLEKLEPERFIDIFGYQKYFHFLLGFSTKLISSPQRKTKSKLVKSATVVKSDLKAPFSIATTPRCRGGHYSFP